MNIKRMRNLLALLLIVPCGAWAADDEQKGYWTGDIDASSINVGTTVGQMAKADRAGVSIMDLTLLVQIVEGKREYVPAADLNGDQVATLDDVSILLDILLGRAQSTWQLYSAKVDGAEGGLTEGGDAGDVPPRMDVKRKR